MYRAVLLIHSRSRTMEAGNVACLKCSHDIYDITLNSIDLLCQTNQQYGSAIPIVTLPNENGRCFHGPLPRTGGHEWC